MNRRQFLKAGVVGVAATQMAALAPEAHGLTAGVGVEFPAPSMTIFDAASQGGLTRLEIDSAIYGLLAGDYVSVVDEANGIDEIMQVTSVQGEEIRVMRGTP